VPPTPAIGAFATGGRLIDSLDPGLVEFVPRDESQAQQAVDNLLADRIPLDTIDVPVDPERRMVAPGEAERRLGQRASVDLGPRVRAVLVDTVNRAGTSRALVDPERIRAELDRAGERWVIVLSHNALPEAALAVLDQSPRVVAAISGNSHRNEVARRGRYWRISTSSLADFPQQARMFRLRETASGVVLETWMVDHDGRGLAGIARELAFLDAQGGRPQHFAGDRPDRNVRLFVTGQ
jgi:hypothetical protein